MKSKDKTKQKKHESTIGKIIYGFLLFMPLLAIGITCAYVIFNKNAYRSYSSVDETQTSNITSTTYDNNTMYNLKYKNESVLDQSVVSFSYISITADDLGISSAVYNTLSTWSLRASNLIWFGDNNNPRLIQKSLTLDIFSNFNFIGTKLPSMFNVFNVTFVNVVESKIDNVFYYSIDKVEESNLFNWATDSVIYTGMSNTCNALNITTTFIPLLLTYWLIISVIYFLYDIILIILHVFHRKIHELEESI